jgi:hypothetical protein
MESHTSTGMKQCLDGEDVAVGVTHGATGATPYLERQSREGSHEADGRPPAQPVFERAAPRESVGENPITFGAPVGQRSGIVVARASRHPEHVAALSRELKDLSGANTGERGDAKGERKDASELYAHWSSV